MRRTVNTVISTNWCNTNIGYYELSQIVIYIVYYLYCTLFIWILSETKEVLILPASVFLFFIFCACVRHDFDQKDNFDLQKGWSVSDRKRCLICVFELS